MSKIFVTLFTNYCTFLRVKKRYNEWGKGTFRQIKGLSKHFLNLKAIISIFHLTEKIT